jgi:hypothetical protein
LTPEEKAYIARIISEYKKLTPRNGRYTEEMLNQKQLLYEKFLKLK